MWFGTWDGLNSIIAGSFKCLSRCRNQHHNNIIRVIEEKNGILWIATDIGINRFNVREKVLSVSSSILLAVK